MNRSFTSHRARGFSLVEILVAFAIASSSLGLLYNIQRNSQRAVISAAEHTVAAELARSLLAESRTHLDAATDSLAGTYADKYDWTLTITPYGPGSAAEGSLLPLSTVSVQVSWHSGTSARQLAMTTVRPAARLLIGQE
jgi:general secretion pathway protein I